MRPSTPGRRAVEMYRVERFARDRSGRPREAASFCQATCTQTANELSLWFGVAGTIGCGLVVGPAGIACGAVGLGLAYKLIDPTPCFEHCLNCYAAMTKTCKESGSKPAECVDTPWTCKNGGPSTSRSMSL